MTGHVVFKRFDAAGAREQREVVSLIHPDAYAERIATGDPAGMVFKPIEPAQARWSAPGDP